MSSPIFKGKDYKETILHKPWELPHIIFQDIKACFQRIARGYSDCDIVDFDYWFLSVVPDMLQELYDQYTALPIHQEQDLDSDNFFKNDKEYMDALQKIIFLFHEADCRTCSRKNPFETEHLRILEEFAKKYESSAEDMQEAPHSLSEVPEYNRIEEKYIDEVLKIAKYQNECKDEAFQLFANYFYSLWT